MNTWKRLRKGWKVAFITLFAAGCGLIASGFYNIGQAVEPMKIIPQNQAVQKQDCKMVTKLIEDKEAFQRTMDLAE